MEPQSAGPGIAALELFPTLDALLLKKGVPVVMCGEVLTDIFFVKSGAVVAEYRHGQRRASITLGAGEFFGEAAVLRDAPSDATVRAAQDDTLVLRVAVDEFKRVLEDRPELRADVIERTARRLLIVDRAPLLRR